MLIQEVSYILPKHWDPMNLNFQQYKLTNLPHYSSEYHRVFDLMNVGIYYNCIQGIYRVQNPTLFSKFRLKMYDFEQKGPYNILSLYHDTARENVISIAKYNFDWRYGERFMFGPGVYFSTSPQLANKHSSKTNGTFRSMFIAEVLTQNVQQVEGNVFLPDYGFDTVQCHNGETFVKYFDGEYFPSYVVDYISL
ncbi:unnamed protein product [Phyllotreta striolata]|uniref:Poly [ADP-ribose] polymerase n=1 Tax=Phyllotreta striolata TaxID=444603 RepID=A0A9N9TJE9_PHYSR|nr:unnamed protein product [Phyllotreta striolata]